LLTTDLLERASDLSETPSRVFLTRTAEHVFSELRASLADPPPQPGARFTVGYSVKTNPDSRLLMLASRSGLLAEVISRDELRWAEACGFPASRVVYNGPVPGPLDKPLHAIFADSIEALEAVTTTPAFSPRTVGVRIRPPTVPSRFGISLSDLRGFATLSSLLRDLPQTARIGVSFHCQSSCYGLRRWTRLAENVVEFAAALADASHRRVDVLDFGGGWTPDDFADLARTCFRSLRSLVTDRLPSVSELIVEPGKALSEPCMAVIARVIEVRRNCDPRQVIVDASVSELPVIHEFPHRLFALGCANIQQLPPGDDIIFGRLCMENDVLSARVALPSWLAEGHLIAFCDAGAYDASMAYTFGRGLPHGLNAE